MDFLWTIFSCKICKKKYSRLRNTGLLAHFTYRILSLRFSKLLNFLTLFLWNSLSVTTPIQVVIESFELQEFSVRAALCHASIAEYADDVCVAHRAEPVSDEHARATGFGGV